MTTVDKILWHLRQEPLTVTELSKRLKVTRNAVIVPLRQLEAKGRVIGRSRRENRVGKPAREYEAVPGREDEKSRAYPDFAALLVETLGENLDRRRLEVMMHQVGSKMAAHLETEQGDSFVQRLKAATGFADRLGADTLVENAEESVTVRSFSCPLARSVRRESCVCGVIAAFFEKVTGAEVQEKCERGKKLICKFVIDKPNEQQSPNQ